MHSCGVRRPFPIYSHASVSAIPFSPTKVTMSPVVKEGEFIRLLFAGGGHYPFSSCHISHLFFSDIV
jgi:hypothetical protein